MHTCAITVFKKYVMVSLPQEHQNLLHLLKESIPHTTLPLKPLKDRSMLTIPCATNEEAQQLASIIEEAKALLLSIEEAPSCDLTIPEELDASIRMALKLDRETFLFRYLIPLSIQTTPERLIPFLSALFPSALERKQFLSEVSSKLPPHALDPLNDWARSQRSH